MSEIRGISIQADLTHDAYSTEHRRYEIAVTIHNVIVFTL